MKRPSLLDEEVENRCRVVTTPTSERAIWSRLISGAWVVSFQRNVTKCER